MSLVIFDIEERVDGRGYIRGKRATVISDSLENSNVGGRVREKRASRPTASFFITVLFLVRSFLVDSLFEKLTSDFIFGSNSNNDGSLFFI